MRSTIFQVAVLVALSASVGGPRQALAQAVQVDPQGSALTEAYNASGRQLLGELFGQPGNIVVSPYAIGSAMAMALSGARGDTERQMRSVLKHSLSRDEIDATNGGVLAVLQNYDRSAVPPTCPAGMELTAGRCRTSPDRNGNCPFSTNREGDGCMGGATFPPSARLLVANALMLVKPGAIAADYAANLRSKYGAELFQNAGLAEVNGWAARKTAGKIDKILDQLDPAGSAAVLLSAVYFKSRWAAPFDEKETKSEPFKLSASQQAQAAMMHRTGYYALVKRPGYRAIRLPYIIPSLALVVVLPNAVDGLADVFRRFDANEQRAVLAALQPSAMREVKLALPRFKADANVDLVPALQRIGMKLAFDDNRADFSGMTGKPAAQDRLRITQIRHRATIEVAEQSTEAAAVAAVEMGPGGGGGGAPPEPPPEVFRVDHPFLFLLADSGTGAVLFAGRIVRPAQP